MSDLGRKELIGIAWGFGLIFLSSCLGFFVRQQVLIDPNPSWHLMLLRSAHGHGSLFGMVHILHSLTVPYSSCSEQAKEWQFGGLLMGSLGMSLLLVVESFLDAEPSINKVLIGTALSCWMCAVVWHTYGIAWTSSKGGVRGR